MTRPLRLRVLQVHRWSGLTLGLLLLFLALTGLSLEFREQLHSVAGPAALERLAACDTPLPLDAQIAGARAAHGTGKYETVVLPEHAGSATLVRFSDNTAVFVDPCTAKAVHEQARWGGLFGRLEQLHRFRFLDDNDIANLVTGAAAIVLAIVMVCGGIFLWWPARGVSKRSAATLRPHLKGRALDLNLHKVLGVWGSAVLLGVALTSLPLAFKWTRSAINTAVGSPEPAARPKSVLPNPEAKALKMGALWDNARAALDHPGKAVLAWPKKKTDSVEIYAIESGAPHGEARSYVHLDAYSGQVLRVEPYAQSSLGNRIYRTCAAIHSGDYGLFLQIVQFLGTLTLPVLAWTGIGSWLRGRRRKAPSGDSFKVRVTAVRREAEGVKSFLLASADGQPLPAFEAGAHIDVHMARGLTRQYSLCGDPREHGHWRIAVKRTQPSRGGSHAMHEQVAVGGELRVSPPRNNFPLEPGARRHVLVGAGIGITPLLAMVKQLAHDGQPFVLHYFARSIEAAAFLEELSLEGREAHVRLHPGLSRDEQRRQLRSLLAHRQDGEHLYLCGPSGFMETARSLTADAWPEEAIHVEHFRGSPQAPAGPRQSFEVQLRKSGKTLLVPADSNLADVLCDHGVPVATSCREGVCGTCVTRVVSGECDHRDSYLSPREREANDRILVCVSRARGPALVLDI